MVVSASFKCYLSIVIIYLGEGDLPAAQLEFNQRLQCLHSPYVLNRVDTYLRSNEIALEEVAFHQPFHPQDLIKACEDFDEDRLEVLKKHNQLNYVQQQVNRIGKNLLIAQPVAWYREEGEELIRQANGDESVPLWALGRGLRSRDAAPKPAAPRVEKSGCVWRR